MRALIVAGKNLRELRRETTLLALVLSLPAVFLAINYFAYDTPYQATYTILFRAPERLGTQRTASLREVLEDAKHPDGRAKFALITLPPGEDATERLVDKQAAGLLELKPGPGASLPSLTWYGDGSDMAFTKAGLQVEHAVAEYAEGLAGLASSGISVSQARPVVQLTQVPLGRGSPRSMFEAFTPGMILFSILFLIPQTALLAGRESRLRTLHRLRLTRMTALDYLGGLTLSQLLVAALQVALMFGLSAVFGFHNHGSVPLALLIFMIAAFSSIGFGMLVACFIEDDSQATNIGSAVTMIQVMLSGVFFPVPSPTLFTVAGHQIGVFDFLPATHAMLAAQQVMCFGASFADVRFRLAALALLSLLLFVLGIRTFQRRKMQVHGG